MHPLLLIVCILLGVVALLFLWLTLSWLPIDPNKKYESENPYYRWMINTCACIVGFVLRIRVRVEGMEKLPKDEKMLLVCNHRSNLDPILTYYVLRKWKPVFVSKQENFHLPWFGRIIHRMRFFSVDRSSIAASRRVFMEASRMLETETSVMVYPEGTRSKSEGMLPFHTAAFIIAVRAKAPVAVMTIRGTEQVNHRFPLYRTNVTLRVLELIPYSWIEEHGMQELSEYVERMMKVDLDIQQD